MIVSPIRAGDLSRLFPHGRLPPQGGIAVQSAALLAMNAVAWCTSSLVPPLWLSRKDDSWEAKVNQKKNK